MSGQDFQRTMPGADVYFSRGRSWWAKTHLDAIMLGLLLLLAGYGLFVFYSASGQSEAAVQRQLVRYGVAFGVMFVVACTPPRLFRRRRAPPTWLPRPCRETPGGAIGERPSAR